MYPSRPKYGGDLYEELKSYQLFDASVSSFKPSSHQCGLVVWWFGGWGRTCVNVEYGRGDVEWFIRVRKQT